jgi:hypothetical protein
MVFQKSQPAETGHKFPLKNMDASPPARKAHANETQEKLAASRTSANCHAPYGVI